MEINTVEVDKKALSQFIKSLKSEETILRVIRRRSRSTIQFAEYGVYQGHLRDEHFTLKTDGNSQSIICFEDIVEVRIIDIAGVMGLLNAQEEARVRLDQNHEGLVKCE